MIIVFLRAGKLNIIYDIKKNTIILNITYNDHINHPVDNIEKITREVKFYIKDNNNNIIVSSHLGHVSNITENSFECIYNGSRVSSTGIYKKKNLSY